MAPLKTNRRQKWRVVPVSRLKVPSEWNGPVLWGLWLSNAAILKSLSWGEMERMPPMPKDFVKELREGKLMKISWSCVLLPYYMCCRWGERRNALTMESSNQVWAASAASAEERLFTWVPELLGLSRAGDSRKAGQLLLLLLLVTALHCKDRAIYPSISSSDPLWEFPVPWQQSLTFGIHSLSASSISALRWCSRYQL